MSHAIPIALVGDFDAAVTAHRAIPEALQLSARRLGVRVASEWIHTKAIGATAQEVAGHAGIWCAGEPVCEHGRGVGGDQSSAGIASAVPGHVRLVVPHIFALALEVWAGLEMMATGKCGTTKEVWSKE